MQNKRAIRVRKKLRSKSDRARLSIFVSNKHIYAQIIDDSQGITVAAVSDRDVKVGKNAEIAQSVGEKIAKLALDKGVTQVALDRGSRKYHGRIKTLADAARSAGLEF
jgi:large subunit ribosomal protein L18